MNRIIFILPFLFLMATIGCTGAGKPKYANVKGKVTFNGKPIDKGQIVFFMEGYTPSTMEIVDGTFNGQAMVGSNKVSISARKKSEKAVKLSKEAESQIKGYQKMFKETNRGGAGTASEFDPTSVDYIPPEWGSQSKEMRVIEGGQMNDFEFNIKSKN